MSAAGRLCPMDAPLLLIDAASLYFRAYYGVPESITAPDGTPVNAVRGFTDMLARLVEQRRPGRLVACLDLDWRPAFRVAAIASYKAHRLAEETGPVAPDVEGVPDTLGPHVPLILDVLAAAGHATRSRWSVQPGICSKWRARTRRRCRWSTSGGGRQKTSCSAPPSSTAAK